MIVISWKNRGVALVASLLLIAFGFIIGTTLVTSQAQSGGVSLLQSAPLTLTDTEQVLANLYNRVSPSVVSINVVARRAGSGYFNEDGIVQGSGSGFVVDQQGHIVTNNHVVDGATSIEVNFVDGTIVRGEIVGVDADSDLAVVKVNLPPEKLSPLPLADSNQLVIGQTTLAIGSPFGQRWTLTTGIISALDRSIQGLSNYQIGKVIQTDAAINPGNSGGPLLNLNGEVIGVNSQIISRSRSSSGVGFAVPSNLVRRVATELITQGFVNYSYMGISSASERDITLAIIENLGLPNNMRGVVVATVGQNSPAANAGLRPAQGFQIVDAEQVPSRADIITAIDGTPVTGMSSLVAYLAEHTTPGQTVNLTIYREGQYFTAPMTLGSRR